MKTKVSVDSYTKRMIRRIAKNIRAYRKERGLTQEDMANHGFGSRWYQRFESGRHIPTLPTLVKLAKAFKVDVRDFFD